MKSILTLLFGGEPANSCFDDEGTLDACRDQETPAATFSALENIVMIVSVVFALLMLMRLASRHQDHNHNTPPPLPR